jgi:hypothetical protein
MRPGAVAGIEHGELVVLMTAGELSAIATEATASV